MPAPVVQYATNRGDARYDARGLQQIGRRTWIDDVGYTYTGDDPSSVLSNNRPNPTPSSGGGGVGGSDIFGNPFFQQYQSSINAAQAADLADTKAAIQQLLIQFGMVPGNFDDKLGALDETIRELIRQNTESGISQYARMLEGKEDAQREAISGLASRGLLRSGAKGYRLRRNATTFDRSLSDSIASLLGGVNQAQSGYAGREFQRQQSLSQLLASLMAAWRPSIPSGPAVPPPPTISTPPSFSAPAYQNSSYATGQLQPSGFAVKTGGGFYTNQQGGGLTSKWQKLAGLS